jgi:hypothetical protein
MNRNLLLEAVRSIQEEVFPLKLQASPGLMREIEKHVPKKSDVDALIQHSGLAIGACMYGLPIEVDQGLEGMACEVDMSDGSVIPIVWKGVGR